MKTFSTAAQAALESGEVITVGAVKIATADPFRVFGGYGEVTLGGEVYQGVGQAGLVSVTGGQLGGAEQAIDLILSGVDPDILPLIEAADVRGAPAVIWRLLFDGAGANLLQASVFARGRVDSMPVEYVPGGTATVRCRIETAARGSGRQTGRMRADADQRQIDAEDGAYKWVTQAATKTLAWGGKPPARAAQTLPGAADVFANYRFTPGGVFER